VIDASSCAHGIADPGDALTAENAERHAEIEVLDSVAWARDRLLPRLELRRRVGSVAVHPTCSVRHLGLAPALVGLAEALAEEVHVPPTATCCGFAGELTASATAAEAGELAGRRFDAHLCSNRTCEIGLERGTGRRYESFAFLLEELTRG
jgi:D-lactate dehydrogenase